MKRSEFLKGMIGVAGVSLLPKGAIADTEKLELFQCYVRGFQYYKGDSKLEDLKQHTSPLRLVREKDNIHDKHAIAVYIQEDKLGYIPRESNYILSKLLDTEMLKLQAKVVHVNSNASAWEKLKIGVWFETV